MSPYGKIFWCRKRLIHIGIPDRERLAELIVGFGRIGSRVSREPQEFWKRFDASRRNCLVFHLRGSHLLSPHRLGIDAGDQSRPVRRANACSGKGMGKANPLAR